MVTCSGGDGGGWSKGEPAMKSSSRPLVYDVETGSLRFAKSRPLNSPASSFKASNVGDHNKGGGSGESSPTCVIQNSTVRSNSSSPTMSTVSKASNQSEEPPKTGRIVKHLGGNNNNTISGRPGLKLGAGVRRMESCAKENEWVMVSHESARRGEKDGTQTPPFKSIQCAVPDKSSVMKKCSQSASIMHKSPGIFSFNATYMSSNFDDFDSPNRDGQLMSRRSTFLMKPTPSKWDDAEKWLSPGEATTALNLSKAKTRSGPLLTTQMVTTGITKSLSTNANPNLIDFTSDEKEQLNLLLDRFSVDDGSLSPSCLNGSFMKLCSRMEKPSSPETRDMGTAMTPEPSRIGTPLRSTTPPLPLPEKDDDHDESSKAMTEKEFQEKTRQEIVTLGTQLGKANIAAAWATKEATKESAIIRKSSKSAIDLENLRRDLFASRADAWKEAEKAKYTSRFQHEEAKIKAWEELEKAKAEAEMTRVEAKAERMKAQAQEKLANKLAGASRQAEDFRVAAETRRSEAAAKATKKAELMKTHGKFTNLLFSSLLCT